MAVEASAATISDPGQGPVVIPPGAHGAVELSGLSWAGDEQFMVVSDNTDSGAHAYRMSCDIDLETGFVLGAPSIDGVINLETGNDPEGIAFERSTGRITVSDEVGPAIRRFDASNGQLIDVLAVPQVYVTGLRSNLGLESMTIAGDGALWTANEEALVPDGEVSSFTAGTIVRLQQFGTDDLAGGQWGYMTDPISADILGSSTGRDVERSGVVDLAALPDGSLLVLERMLGGQPPTNWPTYRIRIYEVDFTAADDTSANPALAIGEFQPVTKTLLWEKSFNLVGPHRNFEGMAVGPELDNGAFALLLVSDDGGFGETSQALYALQIELSSSIFRDGFEGGDFSEWVDPSPVSAPHLPY